MHYLIITLLLLSGCQSMTTSTNSKYGTSSQGIAIHQLNTSKLKIGMHKKQVANLIGNPPHINPFSPDVWTYYQMTHGSINQGSVLKLTFKNNKLIKIEKIDTRKQDQAAK